ncbi:hypothetical protein GGI15_003514 [Coemansia interrupta]|uniref:Eukaryotic translation initiation factor 2-alpha kinase 1 n=1 Tax=Coemansia interrupta TaxID=1126814 RepID=A0A9W8H733_9FUNG|nr:hypothetical protein GGI15_003514 [Coemansia interrupta]
MTQSHFGITRPRSPSAASSGSSINTALKSDAINRYKAGMRDWSSSDSNSFSQSQSPTSQPRDAASRPSTHGPYRRFWATASPSEPSLIESHIAANVKPRPRRSSTAPKFSTSRHESEDSSSVVVFDSNSGEDSYGASRALVNVRKGPATAQRLQMQLQKQQQQQQSFGVPGAMGRDHQSRVLFVALLENYCQTHGDDPLRNRRLFFAICRTLYAMGIIGKEYVDEMANIRSTYSDAFRQLVIKAQESLDLCEPSDIESGIRTLMTGVEEDSDSYGNGDFTNEPDDLDSEKSGSLSESSLSDFDDDDDEVEEFGSRKYATVPASRSTTWLSGNERPPVSSVRSSTASSRGFVSASAASFRESRWHNQSGSQRRRGGPSHASLSASPGSTFGSMVMDMQRSRYHDDFVQLRCLGKGGFGKVYEVRNKLDGRGYAVKQIKIKGEITADKTLREIKTLANLDHPNIVRYYSSWIEVTRVRSRGFHQRQQSGLASAKSPSPLAAFYGMMNGGDEEEDFDCDLSIAGDCGAIYGEGEAAVVAEVSVGHSSVPKSWSVEAANTIVFEQSGEISAPASDSDDGTGDEDVDCQSSGNSDSSSDEDEDEDNGVVDIEEDSFANEIVFAYEDCSIANGNSVVAGFPCINSSVSGDASSSSESSDESECSNDLVDDNDVLVRFSPAAKPIPIKSHLGHRRRRSVHAPVGPFTPSSDSAGFASGSKSGRNPGSHPSQARSLPSQSMELCPSLVAETTLFVQMQLCQTTLQEFLTQRNARIADQQNARRAKESEECDPWDAYEQNQWLIDPVMNIRLFRSIVEGVKFFHSRGVIHRDLKGANVFLDITYVDSGGNTLSRGGSGIGRPSDSGQPQTLANLLIPRGFGSSNTSPGVTSESHADAWDAIDGANLRDRGSRNVDWDFVFEAMQASCTRAPAVAPHGYSLSASSSSSSRLPAPGVAKRLQRDAVPLVPRAPIVTFIPRIGDFGLATKATLGIRPSTGGKYAFIGEEAAEDSLCTGTDVPSSSECRTSNVGTITYAAPEQLSQQQQQQQQTNGYNEKADIYSLGIIFFELYYAFTTAMERVSVIKELRQGVFPANFVNMWPKEAALILRLMDPDPDKRPSAREILAMDLIDVPSLESAQLKKEVLALKQQLYQANQRNEELDMRVRELERIVDLSMK